MDNIFKTNTILLKNIIINNYKINYSFTFQLEKYKTIYVNSLISTLNRKQFKEDKLHKC